MKGKFYSEGARKAMFVIAVCIGFLYVWGARSPQGYLNLSFFVDWLLAVPAQLIGVPFPNSENADAYDAERVTVANIFLIFVYFFAVWVSVDSTDATENHKWADSVYFVGFILTLFSLISALTSVRDLSGPTAIKGIIVQNAIALSSTAVALIIRTFWKLGIREVHSELDYVEQLRATYIDLEKQVSQTTETFRERARQISIAGEYLESSIGDLGKKINGIQIDPEFLANIVSQSVNRAFEVMSSDVELLRSSFSKASNDIQTSVANFVYNISELDAKAQFEEQLSRTFSSLQDSMANSWDRTLSELTEKLEVFEQSLSKGGESVQSFADKIKEQISEFNLTAAISQEARSAFSDFGQEATNQITQILEPLSHSVSALSRQLHESLQNVAEANDEFGRKLLSLDIANQVETGIAPALQSLSNALEAQAGPLRKALLDLTESASATRDSISRIVDSEATIVKQSEEWLLQAGTLSGFLGSYKSDLESILQSIENNVEFVENSSKIQHELRGLRNVLESIANSAMASEGGQQNWFSSLFRRRS